MIEEFYVQFDMFYVYTMDIVIILSDTLQIWYFTDAILSDKQLYQKWPGYLPLSQNGNNKYNPLLSLVCQQNGWKHKL